MISIPAPLRERLFPIVGRAKAKYLFQSTLPRGSDLLDAQAMTVPIDFNPRSLAGATLRPSLMLILEIMYFNPRSLTGATGGGIVAQLLEQFQSTLPRGSDADEHLLQAVLRISIHAPSRERQGLLQLLAIGAGISIHAPSRERPETSYTALHR